ncbi:MAG: site-2 protease family protein [Parachlamydiales bacterium]|nr:site-2 protease family protein [Parachlamydiales bacterium]
MMRLQGKIPISIHPLFWVLAGIIGYWSSRTLTGMFLWIGIIFISVLVHEMGHALTAIAFGLHPQIQLIAVGGVTSYEAKHLSYWKQFLIVLDGPVFGFFLFVLAWGVLHTGIVTNATFMGFLQILWVVNLFWTIVNLVPVMPLDGGQLLRIAMEAIFGLRGLQISFFMGMVIALIISLFFFLTRGLLIGVLFFLFAFQSFDAWRKTKFMTSSDRQEENSEQLQKAEKKLKEGKKEEAKKLLLALRETTKEGLIFLAATHYLAFIFYEEHENHKAYEMLLSMQDQLADDDMALMHELAFEEKNYSLVAHLSSKAFQLGQNVNVAIRNAKAFAYLNDPKPSGGWLHTAQKIGHIDSSMIMQDPAFDSVREEEEFQKFFENK